MNTEASSYPSSDIASAIDQGSIKSDTCCDTATRGCARKCPCRLWIQCNYYVDITERQAKLKNKSDKGYSDICEWYDTNFRIQYGYGDILGNG